MSQWLRKMFNPWSNPRPITRKNQNTRHAEVNLNSINESHVNPRQLTRTVRFRENNSRRRFSKPPQGSSRRRNSKPSQGTSKLSQDSLRKSVSKPSHGSSRRRESKPPQYHPDPSFPNNIPGAASKSQMRMSLSAKGWSNIMGNRRPSETNERRANISEGGPAKQSKPTNLHERIKMIRKQQQEKFYSGKGTKF